MSYLSAIERNYLLRKLGKTDTGTPINQLRREWYAKVIGNADMNATTPLNELEWRWLLKTLQDAGLTQTEDDYDDLWRLMVTSLGLTPQKYIEDNQKIYYRNAP